MNLFPGLSAKIGAALGVIGGATIGHYLGERWQHPWIGAAIGAVGAGTAGYLIGQAIEPRINPNQIAPTDVPALPAGTKWVEVNTDGNLILRSFTLAPNARWRALYRADHLVRKSEVSGNSLDESSDVAWYTIYASRPADWPGPDPENEGSLAYVEGQETATGGRFDFPLKMWRAG